MKILISLFLLVACKNYSVRIAQLETELKGCRAQSVPAVPPPQMNPAPQADQAVPPSTATLQEESWTIITVDHGQSWTGVGQEFDDVDSDITDEHFPPEDGGTSQVAIAPLKLHRDDEGGISTEEALKRLAAQGLRPATARETRAYAKAFPERQREFPMVALGSPWVNPAGFRGVSFRLVLVWPGKRALLLSWSGVGWISAWRFLAVRK